MESSVFKSIFMNTLAQGLGKFVSLSFSVVVITGILTRYLSPSGYGVYIFVTSLVLFFGNISDWGTNIITVREASKISKRDLIFSSSILFRLFLSVLSFILLNLLVFLNPSWHVFSTLILLASFILLFVSLKTSLGIIFQTILKMQLTALVEIVSTVSFLLLILVTVKFNLHLYGIMVAWVFATALSVLAGIILGWRYLPKHWGIDTVLIKKIFFEAAPTGALLLFFSIYNRVDIVILQHFQGSSAVGFYGLSYKVYENLVLVAAFLMNALFPILAKNFSVSPTNIKTYYQKTFDVLLFLGILFFITTLIAAPIVIDILGGSQYFPSIVLLRILSFAILVSYLNHLTGYSLIAFGKQKISLMIASFALVFNFSLNWILIPIYSYNAAAVLTIATEVIVFLLSSLAIWKFFGILPSPFSFPKTIFLWSCDLIKEKRNGK